MFVLCYISIKLSKFIGLRISPRIGGYRRHPQTFAVEQLHGLWVFYFKEVVDA